MRILGIHGAVPLTSQRLAATGGATTEAAGGQLEPIVDELSLSQGAQALAESGAEPPGVFGPRLSGGAIYVEDIRGNYEQNLAGLRDRLRQQFAEHGIDTSSEIRLQTASDGSVFVAGDHPQKAEIEQLFVDQPQLRDRFVQVDAQASFMRAVEESMAFQRAYRDNPEAAVQQFAHLFDGSPNPVFSLLIRGDELQPVFDER